MSRQIKVVHARDFIAAKPDSQLDLEESKRLLLDVSGFMDSDGAPPFAPCEILVDTRGAVSELSCADLWYLADCLAEKQQVAECRIAVLCPPERFDYASFYVLCAERRGIRMQAFTSYEEAMNWLQAPLEPPTPSPFPPEKGARA